MGAVLKRLWPRREREDVANSAQAATPQTAVAPQVEPEAPARETERRESETTED